MKLARLTALWCVALSERGGGAGSATHRERRLLRLPLGRELVTTNAAGKAVSLFVDEAKFAASIHAKHSVHELPRRHHRGAASRQLHREAGLLHPVPPGRDGDLPESDHGLAIHKGVPEAASCKDCHGSNHYLLNYRNPDSPVYRANIPQTCARCHGNTAEMEKFHLRQRSPVVSYDKSVHGLALLEKSDMNAAVCTDCHGSHDLHKSTNPASKLYWQNVPDTCGKCHENVEQTYMRSVHGKAVKGGVRDAPVCTDCHGEHTIAAVKLASLRVSPANIPETCGQCHAAQRIVTHTACRRTCSAPTCRVSTAWRCKAARRRSANCASCHGVHDILPSSDPLSSVNPTNLPQTCGKCHPGIGTRLAREFFRIHAPPGAAEGKPWLVNLVTRLYIVLIVADHRRHGRLQLPRLPPKTRAHIRAVKQTRRRTAPDPVAARPALRADGHFHPAGVHRLCAQVPGRDVELAVSGARRTAAPCAA